MADDRPVGDLVDELVAMKKRLDDLTSTMADRVSRLSTGDVEWTLRLTPKPGTLIANGQLVSRDTYKVLWQWAQDQNLVSPATPGRFSPGNGTTTFGVPNLAGVVLLGAGTLGADTYAAGATGGASSRILSVANLPAHDHNVAINSAGGHNHPGSGALADGSHGGHNSGSFGVASGSAGATAGNGDTSGGNHNHSLSLSTDGAHSHTVTESSIGSGTAFDNRPPYNAGLVLIYT